MNPARQPPEVYLTLAVWAGAALTTLVLIVRTFAWTVRNDLFFYGDEFGNLGTIAWSPYSAIMALLPQRVYNDRPIGFLMIRLLYEAFGFNFEPQVVILIGLHIVTFGFAFLLLRKLLDSIVYALAAAIFFGANFSTTSSVWYIGAIFDLLCTLFLVASMWAWLRGRFSRFLVSPLLFFLAARSKEFAITLPVILFFLACREQRISPRHLWLGVRGALLSIAPHLLVLGVLLGAYARTLPDYLAISKTAPNDPYIAVSFAPSSLLEKLGQYVSVFVYQDMLGQSLPAARAYAAILICALLYAVVRRRFVVFLGLFAFLAFLLPVVVLPRIHSTFYVYGPSLFLFLAAADLIRTPVEAGRRRLKLPQWSPALAVYLASMLTVVALSHTDYAFKRTSFTLEMRRQLFRDAQVVLDGRLRFGPGAHYYINGLPSYWNVFSSGPCYFPQIYYNDPYIRCFLEAPQEQLLKLYAADTAERYFFDYKDGELILRESSAASGRPA